jgi:DNA modification methylase
MKIEKRKINELKFYPGNPRKISSDMLGNLKRSLQEFGVVENLVINTKNQVIGGNQRLKALKELGIDEVDVIVVDLPVEKEKALNIALNKIQGEWDYPLLKEILESLDSEIELTGFSKQEIEQLLSEFGTNTNEKEKEDVEKRATLGSIWQLGNHRIGCGDSGDISFIRKLLEDKQINLIITSPPYAEQRKKEYKSISTEQYPIWFNELSQNFMKILKDDGSFFLNIKEHCENGQRSLYVMKTIIMMVEAGWKYIDELMWYKTGLPGGWINRLRCVFEPVYWFSKDYPSIIEREIEEGIDEEYLVDEYERIFHFSKQTKIKFYPISVGKISNQVEIYSPLNKGKNEETGNIAVKAPKKKGIARPGNVIKLTGNNESWKHPAMFPVGLPEFFIRLTTEKNDRILDPFLGSGSSLIAAEKTGRICYGIDLKPEYIDISLTRWEKFTGRKAIKV